MAQKPTKIEANVSPRVLGLEFRSRIFGFCILEGGTKVLDCGVRRYGIKATHAIGTLLDCYEPSLVVIRRWWDSTGSRSSPVADSMAQSASWAVQQRGTTCFMIPGEKYLDFYAERGCRTKHAIASLVAEWFPEVSARLPAKRRAWDGERPRALIFDAIAAAVACLATK